MRTAVNLTVRLPLCILRGWDEFSALIWASSLPISHLTVDQEPLDRFPATL